MHTLLPGPYPLDRPHKANGVRTWGTRDQPVVCACVQAGYGSSRIGAREGREYHLSRPLKARLAVAKRAPETREARRGAGAHVGAARVRVPLTAQAPIRQHDPRLA